MRLYERFLRKAPKQSRSRSVVEAVLDDAAVELLPGNDADDADDAVTLNDIATRAGVGVGSLDDYFADRGSALSGLDLTFAMYVGDVRTPRAVLRVAHRAGLMPTIADSQMRFSGRS